MSPFCDDITFLAYEKAPLFCDAYIKVHGKNISLVVDGNFPTALHLAELVPGVLDSRKWMYIPSTAADCCEDTAAVEAFDATFPPKEKTWMPSQ